MFSNTKGQCSYWQVCIYFMGCVKDETLHQSNLLLRGAAEDGEVRRFSQTLLWVRAMCELITSEILRCADHVSVTAVIIEGSLISWLASKFSKRSHSGNRNMGKEAWVLTEFLGDILKPTCFRATELQLSNDNCTGEERNDLLWAKPVCSGSWKAYLINCASSSKLSCI